jgi:hypothetical protein
VHLISRIISVVSFAFLCSLLTNFPPLVEYAGFEFDIRNKFPSESIRKEFLKHFLLQTYQLHLNDPPSDDLNHTPIPCYNGTISEEFIAGVDVSASHLLLPSPPPLPHPPDIMFLIS